MNSKIDQLYKKNQYKDIVELVKCNRVFEDYDVEKIIISSYKCEDYNLCLQIFDTIAPSLLANYLLNEILGECYLENNELELAYEYFNKAVNLKPSLKAARQKRLILNQRLGYDLDIKELEVCIDIAYQSKKIDWLRSNAYIAYSNLLFKLSNRCLRSIITLGGNLNYLDKMTFTLLGEDGAVINNWEAIDITTPALYESTFLKKNSEKLVVTLATANNIAFKSYDFKCDTFNVIDKTGSYYIFSVSKIADDIVKLAAKKSYQKISIVGASKAGSGALMLYELLAKKMKIKINCVAFSPQVKIYPFNSNLKIPSYKKFSKVLDLHPIARYLLSKVVQPTEILVRDNDEVTVIYGNGFEMDTIESSFINSSSGITKVELKYSGHASSIPLTIPKGKDKEELRGRYSRLIENKDNDFIKLGGGNTVDLIDEIWSIYQDSNMELNNFL